MSENGQVTLTINDREVKTDPGRLLIDVAEEHDIFVPRFCYHPGLESVAACRMCLVEIEGSRKPLDPACATYVADGMAVRTNSEMAVEAQESVLELLLINHPLDCPICDRGGECPLQDQALTFGPGSSRYGEGKRHYPKPIPISDLVMLDRERCVLCWRCVRFCEEVSGDTFIDLMDRGSLTQINIAQDAPFDSYFSGNTIQICPVGALTSKPYRFLSRPWDLLTTESTCSFCSVGCPISIEQRGGEIQRAQALPNENVNSFWNCDKGRFGHRYPSAPDRLRAPLIRRTGESGRQEFADADWDDALDSIADRLRAVIERRGPSAVGLIGGSHATNEDLYAASRLMREVVKSPNLDFRTFDAGFAYDEIFAGEITGSTARLDDLDAAKVIIWIGPDPKEELPVLYLRLRRAVTRGARLITVNPRRISLARLGIHIPFDAGVGAVRLLAEEDRGPPNENLKRARELLAEGPVVICVGPQFVGTRIPRTEETIGRLAERLDGKVLMCLPNANSQGALDMGVYPGRAAGHVSAPAGLDTKKMLEATAAGDVEFLWIMGADLTHDFPDADLVNRAFSSDAFIVTSELFPTETALAADVLLPATSFAEKEGTFTNFERRLQKVDPAVSPPGSARSDWQIFSEVAIRLGVDFGWSSSADVVEEIAAEVPTHIEFAWERLAQPPASNREMVSVPPEVGHATGESGNPVSMGSTSETIDFQRAGRSENAWPLRWELRAVDATRRSGWIWPLPEGEAASFGEFVAGGSTGVGPPGDGLVLLAARALYDAGPMVSRSVELAGLTPPSSVELHPDEATARGLQAGEEVAVRSPRGELRMTLRVSEDTPPGAAFILFDQPGAPANTLMDSSYVMTRVEVSR